MDKKKSFPKVKLLSKFFNVKDKNVTLRNGVLIFFTEAEMTPAQKEEEQRILEELLEVVEQRDSLVALLEEDRLR